MKNQISLSGQSPLFPIDAVLQAISGQGLSGCLDAKTSTGEVYRLFFTHGRLVGTNAECMDDVGVVGALIATESTWTFEAFPELSVALIPQKPDFQSVLLEVARVNDEASRS